MPFATAFCMTKHEKDQAQNGCFSKNKKVML